jgi:hypothetical protein
MQKMEKKENVRELPKKPKENVTAHPIPANVLQAIQQIDAAQNMLRLQMDLQVERALRLCGVTDPDLRVRIEGGSLIVTKVEAEK